MQFKRRLIALESPWVAIVLIIAIIVVVRGLYGMWGKLGRADANLEEVRAEVADLEAREAFLAESIELLKTPAGQERELRSMYNVAKEGEEIIVIVEPDTNTDMSIVAKESWWQRFLNLFR